MKILSPSKRTAIQTLADWNKIYTGAKSHQWADDRSAKSTAKFVLEKNGIEFFENQYSKIFSKNLTIDTIIPELETKLDQFKSGRNHDLGIFLSNNEYKVFSGVEAKVDESFGENIDRYYLKAIAARLNGEKTNKPERINQLLQALFRKVDISCFSFRYQLLHGLIGTIKEAESKKCDAAIFHILVFKTNKFDEKKNRANSKDFEKFISVLGKHALIESQEGNNYSVTVDSGMDVYIMKTEIDMV